MRFIFQYPEKQGAEGDLLDAGPIPVLAAAAERSGWHGIAFTEHPAPSARWLDAGGHQTLDPFVALAAAAAATSRLRLLTYLAVLPYRNPLLVAKTAASLDRISDGRFILGAGAGYLKSEFVALGADFATRNESLEEALDVLERSWQGRPFSYEGRGWSARDALTLPAPVQRPIPIWLGGNARITLQRVAERAQGWLPLIGPAALATTTRTAAVASLEDLAARIAVLRDLAGERFADLDIAVPLPGGDPTRDAERQRDTLGRLQELGATWIIVGGRSNPFPAALDFLEAFATEQLRAPGSGADPAAGRRTAS